ncbi:hypothetical protein A2154_04560 [Candidatus Gottesmanbacteria bacterium RBG_16_43_7]|uniref:Gas vesicle protein n=1 Tax=Candidatus Gottesmanbacteria bacterium RBG_16_43_7 TaxID=1798373 RepID=A0A1F5ZBQ5_9BACT|nr:MAG: hypothetical protein A2154_04560 [Candidatus Gottesmanbacteria bacterium RBG_16_43_7]
MNESKKDDFRFWFGFFLGGLLGALTLFFLGTKEGKKAARSIKRKGEDLVDDLQEKLDEIKDRGQRLLEETNQLKEKITDTISDKKDELTQDVAQKIDTTLASIESIQERGLESTANLRKDLGKSSRKSTKE